MMKIMQKWANHTLRLYVGNCALHTARFMSEKPILIQLALRVGRNLRYAGATWSQPGARQRRTKVVSTKIGATALVLFVHQITF